MTADDIVAAARACIGTPFVHQGRIPGVALDCAGLVVAVAESVGVEYADHAGYGRNPANGLLESVLDVQPFLTRVFDRKPGDVLLMRFAGEPQHLAIFTGDNIIHSYESVGKVCEHRMADVWAVRIVRVYRFKGVA